MYWRKLAPPPIASLSSTFSCSMKAITPNTILLVGSAPEYAYGMVDPLEDISTIALEKGLPMHVDACFGGFMLPW